MNQPPSEKEVAKARPSSGAAKKVPKLSLTKSPEPAAPHWLVRMVRAPGILATVWPLVVVVAGYAAWQAWGAERVGRHFYGLEQAKITTTAAPSYVRRNLIAEVFETHQLEKTSLLDRKATASIGEAFRTHPWVQDVLRVEKSGDGVSVQLRYRKPVAVVRVQSRHPEVMGQAVFFVDRFGVLLPTEDFQEDDRLQYLEIEVEDTYPAGGYGGPYGDQRVIDAAAIAGLLDPVKNDLELAAIRLTNPQRTFNEPSIYEIIRRDGSHLIWGSPPGQEQPTEAIAVDKLERLKSGGRPPQDLRIAKLP